MKKLEPFAVRTKNLTDEQLADMFLLAANAGAVIDEGNEELRNRRGRNVSVFDKDMYELAGVDVDFDTRIDDGAESFIQNDEDHAFYLFANYEDAREYLNSIIESQNEEPANTEIEWKGTKLYTKDKELIKKYAKLCGCDDFKYIQGGDYIGALFDGDHVRLFEEGSGMDSGYSPYQSVVSVSSELVEIKYAEKFGKETENEWSHTKVYTSDPEIINMYAALCGVKTLRCPKETGVSDPVGVWFKSGFGCLFWFSSTSEVARGEILNGEKIKEVWAGDVKKAYVERFAIELKPNNSPDFTQPREIVADDTPKLEYKAEANFETLWLDGDCVFLKCHKEKRIRIPQGDNKLSDLEVILTKCRELTK